MTSSASSVRPPRSFNGMPHTSKPAGLEFREPPTPTPRITLPSEMTSAVATCLATMAGFLSGSSSTPVPTVILCVQDTKAWSDIRMSSAGSSFTSPSVTHTPSKPIDSTASPNWGIGTTECRRL